MVFIVDEAGEATFEYLRYPTYLPERSDLLKLFIDDTRKRGSLRCNGHSG
jgi:hypothetical protein